MKNLSLNKVKNPNKIRENKMMKSDKVKCLDILSYMDPEKYNDICKMVENISFEARNRKISEGYKVDMKFETKREDIKDNSLDKINKILLKNKNSNIGIFLSSIDCNKEYTKSELESLLLSSKYKQPKAIFCSITNPESTWGPGYIFEVVDEDKYKIRKELCAAWN